ncbi:MAG: hypothetical protein ACRC0J_06280 [Shewanella oncorhynchi]
MKWANWFSLAAFGNEYPFAGIIIGEVVSLHDKLKWRSDQGVDQAE